MQVVYPRCCGLDVHQKTVVACLLTLEVNGQRRKQIETFGTMTADLAKLVEWLKAAGCTHVAMESTGVYWKPVYNLLEGQFEILVVNAQHLKAVPGRKTDVLDAEWIADLLQHGLLRGSFVPSADQRELRDLTRYRVTLVQERARTINRLHKVLEEANIKLATVATNVMGVSGRAMIEALLTGHAEPHTLADLARGRLRTKRAQLEQALAGRVQVHQRFLLAEHLSHIDYLDEAIERVSAEIEARLQSQQTHLEHLDTIPGVSRDTAEVVLAEIRTDMSRFGDAKHLASWAGMCPGNNESAGKRKSGKARKGSPWLRQVLIEAAHAAAKTKHTYLSALFHRLVGRRGRKKAVLAVGHAILVIVYYLLIHNEAYRDLGANDFDEREHQKVERRLVARLNKLGYDVQLQPVAQPA